MTKTIVQGLLTFAALSSLAFAQEKGAAPQAPQGAAPGWTATPGKGVTFTNGDSFGLTVGGQLQTNFTYTGNDSSADTSGFNVPRARLDLKGYAFGKNLTYFLQLDGTDTGASKGGALKEGLVTWSFLNHTDYSIGLRAGQGKCNYGFEGTGTSKGTFFTETSAATKAFANGYTRGAWLMGNGMDNKMRWVVGAMNGDVAGGLGDNYLDKGEEASNSDNELSYVAGFNFDPLGKLFDGSSNNDFRQGDFRTENKDLRGTIGVGFNLNNGKDDSGGPNDGDDIESTSVNLNTVWNVQGFQFMGEYFMREDKLDTSGAPDKEKPDGFFVSASYVLPKSGDGPIQWGFGLRYSQISTDAGDNGDVDYLTGGRGIGSDEGDATEITVVVDAFYHQHAAKTQFEYTWQEVDPNGGSKDTNHIVSIAFQLLF